tara:strand:+ start:739 stop:1140 length:402 start_codon:yes stop_codon:yes gene_type:complete
MKKDYSEEVESLVTFGDNGLTLRKDDPRTKKYLKKKEKKMKNMMERSIFEGVNLSEKREDSETYEDYKDRLKLNKTFLKIYKNNGTDRSWELFPDGFKSAAETVQQSLTKPKFVATIDGEEIPVTINNNDKDE